VEVVGFPVSVVFAEWFGSLETLDKTVVKVAILAVTIGKVDLCEKLEELEFALVLSSFGGTLS
jgi:hypothetical protein